MSWFRFWDFSTCYYYYCYRCFQSKKRAEQRHMNVMRLLVRRYITEMQRKADEKGVTEDDINEVKQDISTFRYELIDILKNNGMNTSMVNAEDSCKYYLFGRTFNILKMSTRNVHSFIFSSGYPHFSW